MKNIKLIQILALLTTSMVGCGNDDHKIHDTNTWQENTKAISAVEPNSYSLYYRPAVGYVGDPMPFYDPQNNVQRILFLMDWRDGSDTYHPIHSVRAIDAAHYQSEGEIISCGTLTEQDPAIGTGCTIVKDGIYYTFYTGHKDNATSDQAKEAILLATSNNGNIWIKNRAFRLDAPEGYSSNDFRDPHVFYSNEDNTYHMVLSTYHNGDPLIAQFVSTDLLTWTLTTPFLNNNWNDRFYECPDVFQMGNYWYMIYSDKDVTRQIQYYYAPTLSELMTRNEDHYPPHEGKLDGTSFYAGKTTSDGTHRFLYGWCASRAGEITEETQDWAGNLVAHQLVQNADGSLGCTIPEAIDTRISSPTDIIENSSEGEVSGSLSTGYTIPAGSSVHFNRLANIDKISFNVQAPTSSEAVFGLYLRDASDSNVRYRLAIEARWQTFRLQKVTTATDGSETIDNITENWNGFDQSTDGKYTVTFVHENSVCVVYLNGKYAFTNRVYNLQHNGWGIYCSDGEVQVNDINRYTE